MRGKAAMAARIPGQYRITPAYAGKSLLGWLPDFMFWDHPRLCGEKRNGKGSQAFEAGSPPPMRGKAFPVRTSDRCERITPAYAGKRKKSTGRHYEKWDHPRLCGEKMYASIKDESLLGSPPPMRGKVLHRTPSAS